MSNRIYDPRKIRYIPPVDTPCYATYAGCYHVSPPINSQTMNPTCTNPACPVRMCSCKSGVNCKCNRSHMNTPYQRRFWTYKWNEY